MSVTQGNKVENENHNMTTMGAASISSEISVDITDSSSGLSLETNGESVEIVPAGNILHVNEADKDLHEELYVIRLLSRKAMHLPNGNWWSDWVNFIKNNHPLFGMCFHHKLHPLKVQHRLYLLLASVSFGLTATNCVYLYNAYNNEEMSKVLIEFALKEDSPLNVENIEALEITYGTFALWTFGGLLHGAFDISIWYFSACACFVSGASCGNNARNRCQTVASYVVLAITGALFASAICFALMRAIYDVRLRLAGEGEVFDEFEWDEIRRVQNFTFLVGYTIELVLAYLVYWPLLVTVLFTGIFPFIGRPKEMERQYQERMHREKKCRVFVTRDDHF